MTFIEELRSNRQKLLDALDANRGAINLDIFEDFYPDKAHFVFELLQNAEDAGATRCSFLLSEEELQFRHNGSRRFSENDIDSITGIHNSTKTKSSDTIGKFGVGFKSVFIYSLAPQIHSGEHSFAITRLVMPEPIDRITDLGDDTVFILPFNNPQKKSAAEAYSEIRVGLEKLSQLTLLFLRGIESLDWEIRGVGQSRLYRVSHSENHVEVVKDAYGTLVMSGHFLRFSEPAAGHETQHVSIAFPLERISDESLIEVQSPLHKVFRIKPAQPGQVSVFFPAEKESSGLRFHIHGPFIPTLDRSSVKDADANDPLFEQLADFAARILREIKDLGFLTADFLGVLPNPSDNLSQRYEPIRKAIVTEMNENDFTPRYSGGYAPAKSLLQAKAAMKDLLDVEDLKRILPVTVGLPCDWAVAANQRNNNVDRFLNSLAIREWGAEQLLEWLKLHFTADAYGSAIGRAGIHDGWLKGKSLDWFQKFYAFIYREFHSRLTLLSMRKLRLVRLTDGSLSVGEGCMFIDESNSGDNLAKWVPREMYSSGEGTNEQKDAFLFLEQMGVKRVGDRERVELLLKGRYQEKYFEPLIEDIKVFISHVESHPADLAMFRDQRIFKREDGKWSAGENVFIDEPFTDTGLGRIYEKQLRPNRFLLSKEYLEIGLAKRDILKFAESLGAISHLQIVGVSCHKNPEWEFLSNAPGKNVTNLLDQDFCIPGFEQDFGGCCPQLSQLVWDTLTETDEMGDFLVATYRKNLKGGSRTAASQLVYQLRNTAWVPQKDSASVTPPCADLNLLPDGFAYDSRDRKWIEALRFGSDLESRKEAKVQEDEILRKTLGISDSESVEDFRELIKAFSQLPPDRRRKHLDDVQQELNFELPESEPKNPEARGQRVAEGAKDALGRETEKRERSVSINREAVKAEAREYLRQQYTNADRAMICQICQRELPFKLEGGEYYFETVEFISELNLRHHQNYLALCPNHAAMFMRANLSKSQLREIFLGLDSDSKMNVDLAHTIYSIYFTKTHKLDFTKVLTADPSITEPTDSP